MDGSRPSGPLPSYCIDALAGTSLCQAGAGLSVTLRTEAEAIEVLDILEAQAAERL